MTGNTILQVSKYIIQITLLSASYFIVHCYFFRLLHLFERSRSQIFLKIGVLKNFTMFTGKYLCWSLFSIKLQAFRPGKRLRRRCFPANIAKFLRTAFFTEHLCGCFCLFQRRGQDRCEHVRWSALQQ